MIQKSLCIVKTVFTESQSKRLQAYKIKCYSLFKKVNRTSTIYRTKPVRNSESKIGFRGCQDRLVTGDTRLNTWLYSIFLLM